MSKVKVINNIHGGLGFYLNPTPESFRLLPKQGSFMEIEVKEAEYIHINQEIIQKGMLWLDDKDMRVRFGIENEEGEKENLNVLRHDEIVALINGHHKTLEKSLSEITEPTVLTQFVDVARELKIDSKAKIDAIEKATRMTIYEED